MNADDFAVCALKNARQWLFVRVSLTTGRIREGWLDIGDEDQDPDSSDHVWEIPPEGVVLHATPDGGARMLIPRESILVLKLPDYAKLLELAAEADDEEAAVEEYEEEEEEEEEEEAAENVKLPTHSAPSELDDFVEWRDQTATPVSLQITRGGLKTIIVFLSILLVILEARHCQ